MEGRRGLGEGSGEKQGSRASQISGRVQKPGGNDRTRASRGVFGPCWSREGAHLPRPECCGQPRLSTLPKTVGLVWVAEI